MLSQEIILGWHTVANASSLRSELVCVVQRKGVKKIAPEDPTLWDINEMLDHSQPPRSQYPSREVSTSAHSYVCVAGGWAWGG